MEDKNKAKKKILFIEDDQPLALAYKRKFTQAGYQVEIADDGQNGLSKASKFQPNIIILDIILPGGMNGFDVLRQLKLTEETKNIPVLMMTNLAEEGQSAKQEGAEEYLLKVNVSLQSLLDKVEVYLKK